MRLTRAAAIIAAHFRVRGSRSCERYFRVPERERDPRDSRRLCRLPRTRGLLSLPRRLLRLARARTAATRPGRASARPATRCTTPLREARTAARVPPSRPPASHATTAPAARQSTESSRRAPASSRLPPQHREPRTRFRAATATPAALPRDRSPAPAGRSRAVTVTRRTTPRRSTPSPEIDCGPLSRATPRTRSEDQPPAQTVSDQRRDLGLRLRRRLVRHVPQGTCGPACRGLGSHAESSCAGYGREYYYDRVQGVAGRIPPRLRSGPSARATVAM
jgi:hypothetical protein